MRVVRPSISGMLVPSTRLTAIEKGWGLQAPESMNLETFGNLENLCPNLQLDLIPDYFHSRFGTQADQLELVIKPKRPISSLAPENKSAQFLLFAANGPFLLTAKLNADIHRAPLMRVQRPELHLL